jgi:hypothetical protein
MAVLCVAGLAFVVAAIVADPYNTGLPRHESQWRQRKPRHYRYVVEIHAFSPKFASPVRVEVKDNVPVKIQPVHSEASYTPETFGEVSTVDRIFDFIRKTLPDRHDRIEMDYHPKWGYPVRAMMAQNTPDGDLEIRISEFTVLP